MENKQKPSSKLMLYEDHKFTDNPVLLRPEMLTWPIIAYGCLDSTLSDSDTIMYRNILQALSNISPFEAHISLRVHEYTKTLIQTKRTWAKIFLDDQSIVTLSHSKKDYPFFRPIEWNETDDTDNATNWSLEQWIDFFRKQLLDRSVFLTVKATNLRGEATALEKSAGNIIVSLA